MNNWVGVTEPQVWALNAICSDIMSYMETQELKFFCPKTIYNDMPPDKCREILIHNAMYFEFKESLKRAMHFLVLNNWNSVDYILGKLPAWQGHVATDASGAFQGQGRIGVCVKPAGLRPIVKCLDIQSICETHFGKVWKAVQGLDNDMAIAVKELLGIFVAVVEFAPLWKNKHVLLECDNAVAIAQVNSLRSAWKPC